MKSNSNKIARKSFFKTIGFGALGLSLSSLLPFNLSGYRKNDKKKLKIKVHPSAVKRNN